MRLHASGWYLMMSRRTENTPVPERAPMQLSPKRWKEMVELGLQLADENKRVHRRLASLRKAEKKLKTRKVSDAETDHAHLD